MPFFCPFATHSSSVKQCLWDCGHDISIILFRKFCLYFLHPLTAHYLHTSVHHLIPVKDWSLRPQNANPTTTTCNAATTIIATDHYSQSRSLCRFLSSYSTNQSPVMHVFVVCVCVCVCACDETSVSLRLCKRSGLLIYWTRQIIY